MEVVEAIAPTNITPPEEYKSLTPVSSTKDARSWHCLLEVGNAGKERDDARARSLYGNGDPLRRGFPWKGIPLYSCLSFRPDSNPDAKYEFYQSPSQESGILPGLQGPKPGQHDQQPSPLPRPGEQKPEALQGITVRRSTPPPHSPRPKPPSARTSGVAHRGKPCVHPLHAGNPAAAPGGGALPGIPRRVDASPPQPSLAAAAAAASRGPRQPPPAPGRGPPPPRRCPGGEKSQSSEARQLPEGRPQNTGHPALRPPGLHTPQT